MAATQFETWASRGAYALDVSDVAWGSRGLWWDDTLGAPAIPPGAPYTITVAVDRSAFAVSVDRYMIDLDP